MLSAKWNPWHEMQGKLLQGWALLKSMISTPNNGNDSRLLAKNQPSTLEDYLHHFDFLRRTKAFQALTMWSHYSTSRNMALAQSYKITTSSHSCSRPIKGRNKARQFRQKSFRHTSGSFENTSLLLDGVYCHFMRYFKVVV